ncbi:microtubule associated protein-domain-containing protein [Mycotypha africana]|uniref:microtubule associated protein-domain-containing protein n=1 Tax=Mycotypha africana TaxID=64632 RepID=UPI002301BD58|nr:microtubule associated protein-domain-containing protein [Mycotypha africana]KAI8975444.1 microtubule associated protein-domain-containing protein [Mycotypha africana]
MDILYSRLSTLLQLWTSLDVDAFTMNKKLDTIIKAVEDLIHSERREKQLLSANIEDLMSNIEYASMLLGVSLESVLNSAVAATEPTFIIQQEQQLQLNSLAITSMYTALNPTYSAEKVLFELNRRLIKEINVRTQHLHEWLLAIQSLCKELDQPFKFKLIEDYIQSDLSWATVQSVSCELRDLSELKATRISDFNRMMCSIQYYWQLLDYNIDVNNDRNDYKDIAQLLDGFLPGCKNITIPITNEKEEISTINDYYNHPSNPFTTLTTDLITMLEQKHDEIKAIYTERHKIFVQSTTKIKTVWNELNLPVLERPSLPNTLATKDMIYLQKLTDELEPLIRSTFDTYIQKFKGQLTSLWDDCLLSEIERTQFIASLYQRSKLRIRTHDSKAEIEQLVNTHIAYLNKIHIEGKQVQRLMQERKDLIRKMIDFEKTASDPRRLFQASFQLLEEERWRNTCLPRLLHLDEKLIQAILEYEKLAGKPILCAGSNQRYLNTLLDEIADREANQTFFGFLNSDPIPQAQHQATVQVTHKRGNSNNNKGNSAGKARPASVSSLNTVVQQQLSPHAALLKSRAKSAILQSSSSTTVAASLHPSHSVPLNHQQNTKRRLGLAQKRQLTLTPPQPHRQSTTTFITKKEQRTTITNKKIKTATPASSTTKRTSEEEEYIRHSRFGLTQATTASNKRYGYQYHPSLSSATSKSVATAATTTASLIPVAVPRVQLTTAKSI